VCGWGGWCGFVPGVSVFFGDHSHCPPTPPRHCARLPFAAPLPRGAHMCASLFSFVDACVGRPHAWVACRAAPLGCGGARGRHWRFDGCADISGVGWLGALGWFVAKPERPMSRPLHIGSHMPIIGCSGHASRGMPFRCGSVCCPTHMGKGTRVPLPIPSPQSPSSPAALHALTPHLTDPHPGACARVYARFWCIGPARSLGACCRKKVEGRC
jgi:hypothetical protein